jgi:hypothetical protein
MATATAGSGRDADPTNLRKTTIPTKKSSP